MMKRKKVLVTHSLLICVWILKMLLFPAFASGEESEPNSKGKKDSQLILLPVVFYTPETKIAGGVGGMYYFRTAKEKKEQHPSSIFAALIYTQKRQALLEFKPDIYLKNGGFHLYGNLGLKKYSEKYYGIGNDTTNDMEENYSFQNATLSLSVMRKVVRKLFIGPQYEFDYNKITEFEETGQLAEGNTLGSKRGCSSGIGIGLEWDGRDNIFFPTRGQLFRFSVKFFDESLGSDFDFKRLNLDFRQYLRILPYHVLAFNGYISLITGEPPFQMLSMMGGEYLMRGYYKGRYRDKNMVAFQAEYRFPIWRRLGGAMFAGYGDVSDEIDGFRLRDFKYSAGGGIRFLINLQERTNLRLDFGFGKDSFGVYATISEAF